MNFNLLFLTKKLNRTWVLSLVGIIILGTGAGLGYWIGNSKTAHPTSLTPTQTVLTNKNPAHETVLKNPDGSWRYTNRLSKETSPYLLLHAHNPVDWYPWGPEAIERAKKENKPIFLSVGYSTCYWCHVMERRVFSNPEIAKQMNQWFINIKVDREERPDLDQIYMSATHLINGSGGWPNSVFLTPSLKPFFAGTYFPPEDKYGRPGFPRVLQALHIAWKNEQGRIEKQAEKVANAIRNVQKEQITSSNSTVLDKQLVKSSIQVLKDSYDSTYGGFGRAPKFPPDHALALLISYYQQNGSPELLKIVTHTLEMMSQGGIYDHLGGGFHRYSTDEKWLIPHFEKMLYNQAQLAKKYLLAFKTTNHPGFRRSAEEIFQFVKKTMTSSEGGFYSALDSQTHGKEGDYYLWTEKEIKKILGSASNLFLEAYSLASMPEGKGKVLYLPKPLKTIADSLDISQKDLQTRLTPLKTALLRDRQKREIPLLDNKIITSWNGLMIDAYAYGYQILNKDTYLDEARRGANFILNQMRDSSGNLFRTYRKGQRKYSGFLEDYAFFIQGLLGLYKATEEKNYLLEAKDLANRMIRLFHDPTTGGFYFTSGTEYLITHPKNPYDSALPSGNSVAAHVLLTLHQITHQENFLRLTRSTLNAFAPLARKNPKAHYNLLHAGLRYLTLNFDGRKIDFETPDRYPSSLFPNLVTVTNSIFPKNPIPGKPFKVSITLQVKEGWHINANPASQEDLVPTTLNVNPNMPVEVISIDYPPAKKLKFGFTEHPLNVYEGQVTIHTTLKLLQDKTPINGQLRFRLDFQPCNDNRCLAPESILIQVDLGIS